MKGTLKINIRNKYIPYLEMVYRHPDVFVDDKDEVDYCIEESIGRFISECEDWRPVVSENDFYHAISYTVEVLLNDSES